MLSNKEGSSGGANGGNGSVATGKKRKKTAVWSRKKLKTGRRLLLQMGCTLTAPPSDPGSDWYELTFKVQIIIYNVFAFYDSAKQISHLYHGRFGIAIHEILYIYGIMEWIGG